MHGVLGVFKLSNYKLRGPSTLRAKVGTAVADGSGDISVVLGFRPQYITTRFISTTLNFECVYIEGWNPTSTDTVALRDVALVVNTAGAGTTTQTLANRWTIAADGFDFKSNYAGITVYYYAIE